MGKIIKRAILPAVLLTGGIVSVIYGARYRISPVIEERKVEEQITIPQPFEPPPFMMQPGAFFPPPPPIVETVIRTDVVTHQVPEPALIREVTFGGVTRADSGDLKRTYSGKPPSLCPT